MSRIVKFVLAANLIALAVLSFAYPNLMVGPGKLIAGHQKLETSCFACHTPGGGASPARCVTCHKPEDIGKLTTTGAAIVKPLTAVPFHQKLTRQDCVACHSDHSSEKRYRLQGRFDHSLLEATSRDGCTTCHKAPTDLMQQQAAGTCTQCHSMTRWTPATFNHGKFFVLDGDHHARCTTCHTRANDYRSYSCYGCHAHTPGKIRSEHVEEGIRNFDNCVLCHRSANKHEGEGRGRGREGRDDD